MLIEQNGHSCVKLNKRKVLVLFLCLSLCVSFFSFSVFADSFSFDFLPIITNWQNDADTFSDSLKVGERQTSSFFIEYSYFNTTEDGYQIFVINVNNSLYFVSESASPTNYYRCITQQTRLSDGVKLYNTDSEVTFNTQSTSFDQNTNLRYKVLNPVFTISDDIPFFTSLSGGLAAVRDYIDNPPSSGPELEPFSYSLAPGNVIFIDVSGSDPSDVAVLTSSTGFSYSASELQNTNQAFGYLDSIPSSFTLPLSGTNNIPWAPAGNPNLYGKYQHKTRSVYAYSSNHQYFVVVNPTYDPYTLASGVVGGDNVAFAYDNSNATNSYIDISGFSARAFKVYSLNSQLIYDSGGWSSVTESDGPSYSGSYDSSTQTWTTVNDTSGESESPPLGGTNNIESDATTSETIFAWLETIASSIGSFFRGSIGAVTSLVASGSEFFRSISGLYSWLPSPVLSVLLNALIIAITIGVIKVFI